MKDVIENEIWRLTDNCTAKRVALLGRAAATTRQRRTFSFAAGILALLSAGSVTSLLADYANPKLMKLLAVLFSTVSGFIALLNSLIVKDSEIQHLYLGASKYLGLRDRCQQLVLNDTMTVKQQQATIAEIQRSYADLDSSFMRHLSGWLPPNYYTPQRHWNKKIAVACFGELKEAHNQLNWMLEARRKRVPDEMNSETGRLDTASPSEALGNRKPGDDAIGSA